MFFLSNRLVGKPLDPVELSAFVGSSAFLLLLPLIRLGRLRLAGNLAVGIGMLLGLGAAASSGGEATPPMMIAVVLPLMAVFLVGIRSGLAWTAVSVAAMAGLWVAVDAGVNLPRSIGADVQLRNRFVAPASQLLLLTLLGLFYEHFRRRSDREMQASQVRVARSERQLRAVFDEATVGIALLDVDGVVLSVNRYGESFLPLAVGDSFPSRLESWSPPSGGDASSHPMKLLEKGRHEFEVPGSNGSSEWVSGSLSHVRDERGEIELCVAVLPEHGTDEEELLRLADRAMYEEKRSGRCRYRFA